MNMNHDEGNPRIQLYVVISILTLLVIWHTVLNNHARDLN